MENPKQLEKLVCELFVAVGMDRPAAKTAAGIFVLQEMRGVITHGLRRVPANLHWITQGVMNPQPHIRIIHDNNATAVIDADRAVGVIGCNFAMEEAIRRAAKFGIGMAAVRNSEHFLSAAPYCIQAAKHDMIGVALSNTNASMGYPGVRGSIIGNNPLGFAAPAEPRPIVFDSSLTVSLGKLEYFKRIGQPVPDEFITLDKHGDRTNDPAKVIDGGTCMPIGNYKGAGIAMLIEILTGILGGGDFLTSVLPPNERIAGQGGEESQCCIAVNVASFMDIAQFKGRMTAMSEILQASGANPPGINSWKKYDLACKQGVLPEADIAAEINRWADRLLPDYPYRPAVG